MNNHKHYDTVIIGSGPGGEGAAMKLTKSGQKVAVVERYHQVGGACTHWGTIPSKALRHSIQSVMDWQNDSFITKSSDAFKIDYPALLERTQSIIQSQVTTKDRHYARNQIDIYAAQAEFINEHELSLIVDGVTIDSLTFDNAVLATGSRPYRPKDIDFDQPCVRDADTILELKSTPKSITIYGAGVIGCEYASIFCNLGVKVNLINTRDSLLSFMDTEITDALSYHLRDQGVVIRHNEVFEKVECGGDTVITHFESGKQIRSDIMLWANGRSGNAFNIGLEAIGVEVNHREQIVVNENFQTSLDHIYAVGDVIGAPGLASASYDQGRYVGALIASGISDWSLISDIPTGIYTSPEISSIGKTEAELTEQKVPYDIALTHFKTLARAKITGRTVGMLKILFHRESLQILGIHCFGDNAAEIIHIGQAIMRQKGEANSLKYFADTTFNYPTMAEAYRVAALNGLNRVE